MSDFQLYEYLVTSGIFYEYMVSEIRSRLGDYFFDKGWIYDIDKDEVIENTFEPRVIVKKIMFQVFFSKNQTSTKVKGLFAEIFPSVDYAFRYIKANNKLKRDKHKELAHRLQRKESDIMLNMVVPEISKRMPSVPIWTIHDSIVTTVGNEVAIRQIMEKIFQREIGHTPTLLVEYWCKDCRREDRMAA
jgi:hypothetical protein